MFSYEIAFNVSQPAVSEKSVSMASTATWYDRDCLYTCGAHSPPKWTIWGIFVFAVLADLVSTSSLTYYLRQSRTGFTKFVVPHSGHLQLLIFLYRTDSMVDVLMLYTINTGIF